LEDDPWIACYRALMPWLARRRGRDLDGMAEAAVEAALVTLWGSLDRARPATDADVHAIVATSDAYHQGWFDAVVGAQLDNWDAALWPPSLQSWTDARHANRGRGKAFRDSVGEHLDVFARFRFRPTLVMAADAQQAARSAAGSARERAATVTADVLNRAWAREDQRGWDDAPWYEYLDVSERVGWAMAALDVPGLRPSEAAGLAWQIADSGAWQGRDRWSAWSATGLPAQFLTELAAALSGRIR
jgi:hypothetical protein